MDPNKRKIDLVLHQYLGVLKGKVLQAHEKGEPYVSGLPGFDHPAIIPSDELEVLAESITDYMETLFNGTEW